MNPTTAREKLSSVKDRIDEIVKRVAAAKVPTIDKLDSMGVSDFGRSGDKQLPGLKKSKGALKLTRRGREEAVVIDIETFDQISKNLISFAQLLQLEKERSLVEEGNEFDLIVAQSQSTDNRAAIDAVFGMSDSGINASYRPGNTERSD